MHLPVLPKAGHVIWWAVWWGGSKEFQSVLLLGVFRTVPPQKWKWWCELSGEILHLRTFCFFSEPLPRRWRVAKFFSTIVWSELHEFSCSFLQGYEHRRSRLPLQRASSGKPKEGVSKGNSRRACRLTSKWLLFILFLIASGIHGSFAVWPSILPGTSTIASMVALCQRSQELWLHDPVAVLFVRKWIKVEA